MYLRSTLVCVSQLYSRLHRLNPLSLTIMNTKVILLLAAFAALAVARPSNDVVDFETDNMEVEQEGTPGKSVTGEYSWVAPNGEEYSVKYIADHLGYRVLETDATPSDAAPADVVVDDVEEAEAEEEEGEEEEGEDEEGEEEDEEEDEE